jgi:hypothetical protein
MRARRVVSRSGEVGAAPANENHLEKILCELCDLNKRSEWVVKLNL